MFNMNNAFKLTPCGPSEPCDYDDCDSDDDITDKDFAVLMKEAAKGETVNEKTYKDLDSNKEDKEIQIENTKKIKPDEGEIEQRGKKRPCRKIIKNPFFTNRLKFSTDLPPRPPVPPPQFLPLADEDSKPKVCAKKKKCKKKKEKAKTESNDEICDTKEEKEPCDGNALLQACECKCDEETDFENQTETLRMRKRCKRSKDNRAQAPCRKKVSDTSIPPQPRRIPALLKDLPLTCPKNIPEVERQIWMSCDKNMQGNTCTKKCKKKERIEQLLNQ